MNIVLNIGGKTFVREENIGSFLTFYDDGVATYDYGQHHYGYTVEVVETTDTQIKMHLRTVTIQSIDYIEREYEEAIYNIADNTLFYYFPYVCMFDPNYLHLQSLDGDYDGAYIGAIDFKAD